MKYTLIPSRGLLHTRAYFSSPDPAAPRNLTNEMLQTISGYEQTAPRQLALNQQYQPQYSALNLDTSRQNLYGYDDASGAHHPGTLEMGAASNTFSRGSDIADVGNLGPAAWAAFMGSNPLLARSLMNLSGRTADSSILSTLNRQAQSGLDAGGALSPQELRAVDQGSRAGFADRGNLMGNQSLGTELLNRDAAVRQRQQQAQQFATGVQGLNMNQADLVGRASQIFGSQFDPFLSVLSRPSNAAASSSGGPASMVGTGGQMFNPTNPYANDVFTQNFNAQQANNAASANASNANTSAYISLASMLLSDKRLKTDVKKTGRKTREGIPIKRFSYRTDKAKRTFEGVMAQDVEKVRPDAVIEDPFSRIKAVDYAQLDDAPFFEIREMLKDAA